MRSMKNWKYCECKIWNLVILYLKSLSQFEYLKFVKLIASVNGMISRTGVNGSIRADSPLLVTYSCRSIGGTLGKILWSRSIQINSRCSQYFSKLLNGCLMAALCANVGEWFMAISGQFLCSSRFLGVGGSLQTNWQMKETSSRWRRW